MKNRRGFLTALTAVFGALIGLPMTAKGRVPAATPSPAPVKAKVSAEAVAFAATFRAFDPALSDAELHAIAINIDASRAAAAALNPKTKPLRNADEMVARFSAAEVL